MTEEVGNLKSLKKFNLSNNELAVIPLSIKHLTLLEALDVSFNKLEIIPDIVLTSL